MLNSKQKGNIGISAALLAFSKLGWTVCIPITDSQDFDLVVEDDEGFLCKVQVKYTASKKPLGNYEVPLRLISGSTKQAYKTVKDTGMDYLFIYTLNDELYLVPGIDITNGSLLTITDTFKEKFKI